MNASSTATMELEDVKVMEKEKTMNVSKHVKRELEDVKVNVKLKLAALWASLMFLYIYVDYFHLYMPGKIQDILAGKVFTFDISYVFLLVALISLTIPALMIFLSVALPAKVSRWANIIIAAVYIPYTLFNLAGEAWAHMVFGAVVEVALLCLIIGFAWKWPAAETRLGSVPIISAAQPVGEAELRRR